MGPDGPSLADDLAAVPKERGAYVRHPLLGRPRATPAAHGAPQRLTAPLYPRFAASRSALHSFLRNWIGEDMGTMREEIDLEAHQRESGQPVTDATLQEVRGCGVWRRWARRWTAWGGDGPLTQ